MCYIESEKRTLNRWYICHTEYICYWMSNVKAGFLHPFQVLIFANYISLFDSLCLVLNVYSTTKNIALLTTYPELNVWAKSKLVFHVLFTSNRHIGTGLQDCELRYPNSHRGDDLLLLIRRHT